MNCVLKEKHFYWNSGGRNGRDVWSYPLPQLRKEAAYIPPRRGGLFGLVLHLDAWTVRLMIRMASEGLLGADWGPWVPNCGPPNAFGAPFGASVRHYECLLLVDSLISCPPNVVCWWIPDYLDPRVPGLVRDIKWQVSPLPSQRIQASLVLHWKHVVNMEKHDSGLSGSHLDLYTNQPDWVNTHESTHFPQKMIELIEFPFRVSWLVIELIHFHRVGDWAENFERLIRLNQFNWFNLKIIMENNETPKIQSIPMMGREVNARGYVLSTVSPFYKRLWAKQAHSFI